jgi:hypothetical protein
VTAAPNQAYARRFVDCPVPLRDSPPIHLILPVDLKPWETQRVIRYIKAWQPPTPDEEINDPARSS